ncbi:uncharacterized protein LOC119558333 [Drosophila subpulchrella]|uniref:uncharacterized protein LOC119558333 n=1 Tax=Drosophila subpulchrella TaxID=1486046 RepID=UPI0018A13E72|nr:uncharacterized protein LOC119558333 [Drosophila subpulchrella]
MDQKLDQKFTMELEIIENGIPESTNLIAPDDIPTNNDPIRAIRLIIMVIILNVCLIMGTVPIFLYMNTLTEVIRERFLDFILVSGGLISIPMLYRMGDLSKGRPNFYYI